MRRFGTGEHESLASAEDFELFLGGEFEEVFAGERIVLFIGLDDTDLGGD